MENNRIYKYYCSVKEIKSIWVDYKDNPVKLDSLFEQYIYLVSKAINDKYGVFVKVIDKERSLADEINDKEDGYYFSDKIDNFIGESNPDFYQTALKDCENIWKSK